jgi:hypothetical protein
VDRYDSLGGEKRGTTGMCMCCGDSTNGHESNLCERCRYEDCTATCHCGRPVFVNDAIEPGFTRGLCEECDTVRCDVDPSQCPYSRRRPKSRGTNEFQSPSRNTEDFYTNTEADAGSYERGRGY